jgi:pimeloyl-ACP methyl ester carboxylesterase
MVPHIVKYSILFFFSVSFLFGQTQKISSEDSVKIAFTVQGEGEPAIVFIPGWSCDKSYWKEQMDVFSKQFKVIAIDLGGQGESGVERKNWTIEAFGEDVTAVINHLKLKKVILVGHSMGGVVIIEAAKLLKGKVLGLVGVDAFQKFEDDWIIKQRDEILKAFKKDFKTVTKQFIKKMFNANSDSVLVNKIAESMSQAPRDIALNSFENALFYDPVPALKEIKLPIVSIDSDMYPVAVEENRKIVEHFTEKTIKDVGHFIMLEKPKQFNEYLFEAVDELTALNQ